MNNYIVIKTVELTPQHQKTGRTHHYKNGEEILMPVTLKIVHYPGEQGYYLLHFDAAGNELTDTFHDTIDDALAQAEWEYSVSVSNWKDIESTS